MPHSTTAGHRPSGLASASHRRPNGRPTRRRPARRPALVLAAAVLAVLLGSACEPAPVESRDKPVLLVHGWNTGGGADCGGNFDNMIGQLRAQGFTGPFVKVGFYTGDTNCDMSLRSWGSFENGSSWKEVAKALSKYVHATYTAKGIAVDLVGHSMGGNIIRGAVYGSSSGQAGFSAPIRVEDAVTLGAPHTGAAWFSGFCFWGQCSTLKPGAADIQWLNQDLNPQGSGGTEWTVFGSTADDVVPADSALFMALWPHKKVKLTDAEHSDYKTRPSIVSHVGDALAKPNV